MFYVAFGKNRLQRKQVTFDRLLTHMPIGPSGLTKIISVYNIGFCGFCVTERDLEASIKKIRKDQYCSHLFS